MSDSERHQIAHYWARIQELEAALGQADDGLSDAIDWFQAYADGHTAKGDTDKAERNQRRADSSRERRQVVRAALRAPK